MVEYGNGAFARSAFSSNAATGIHEGKSLGENFAKLSSRKTGGFRMLSGDNMEVGKLEELKNREGQLSKLLAEVRREKLSVIRNRPLTIGVVGFGRFGQFISKTFAKYGRVVATSRSDYSDLANEMGVKYVPLSDMDAFFAEGLDVVVLAVSIMSFEATVRDLVPYIQKDLSRRYPTHVNGNDEDFARGPLVVDVLSVKEYPRRVMLNLLPPECDILCTHPMFGPDSGRNGWDDLKFVYEKTRINSVVMESCTADECFLDNEAFLDAKGAIHSIHENSDAYIEGMDRMERFLSIWEEEGCGMVQMSCADHDTHAANSQFITHLMGRILGSQGLSSTPIDTKGFSSVLQLVDSTTSDSFDLFYGLYKYNQNSVNTIRQLRSAMDNVVELLERQEKEELGEENKQEPEFLSRSMGNYLKSLSNGAAKEATPQHSYRPSTMETTSPGSTSFESFVKSQGQGV